MIDIRKQYFDWLSSVINLPDHTRVLEKLFNTEFVWYIPFDANRAEDGIELRYRFGRVFNIPDPIICSDLDLGVPCSVLEMMVALALRSEEQFMRDDDIGDRTPLWIHMMMDNLGLLRYSDDRYSEAAVDRIIYTFLHRLYSRTGKGGLFEIPNLDPSKDMRTVELWYQMCWHCNYLNDN